MYYQDEIPNLIPMGNYYLKLTISMSFLFFMSNNAPLYGNSVPQIRFSNINKTQGLPSNNVNALIKDNLGFIWIATSDGLCRYDAKNRFKVYRPDIKTPNGLKTSNIRTLYFDHNNILWIGTRLGGLTRLDQSTGEWKTFLHDSKNKQSISNNEILTIHEDSKDRLWIGTEEGLNLYHPETESFTSFQVAKNDPNSLNSKAVLSILEDRNGWIWVGTWAGGLHLMLPPKDGDIKNASFRNFTPSQDKDSKNVWKIYQDDAKRFWIGTHNGGLFLMQLPDNATNNLNEQNWEPLFHQYKSNVNEENYISNNAIQDILQDSQGRLWIGTVHGLNHIEPADMPLTGYYKDAPKLHFNHHFFDSPNSNSLVHDNVTNIYEDTQGLIWISTLNGISTYNWYTSQFDIHEFFDQLANAPNCQNIYIDQAGIAWVGAGDNGLIKYDFNKNTIIPFDEDKKILSNDYITALISPDDTLLYVSTQNGINIVNMHTLEAKIFSTPDWLRKQFPQFIIHSIYKDNNDKVWMGTKHGLIVLNEKTGIYKAFVHAPENPSSISDNSINSIFGDSKGFLWIATFNGLNRIDLKQGENIVFEKFRHNPDDPQNSISSNQLTAIEEMDEILYIGTTYGLCSYDLNTNKFFNYSTKGHKLRIQSLEKEEEGGDLWGSTNEGIFYFNPHSLTSNLFEKKDGLGDLTFRLSSSHKDKNGYIYFGSRKGITRLHPNRIIRNTTPPPVFITEIRKMNPEGDQIENTIYQKTISLNYNDYYLSINFSALNYNRLEKNRFAYKLEGFDEAWNYTTSTMPVVYTNLDHGTYTFHVKAANNDGIWNQEGSKLTIIKKPAFWETWWFKILVFWGIASIIRLSIKIHTKNINQRNQALKKYNKNLSIEISERKRIEMALQQRENFLWLLMDNIPQYVYWIDRNHCFAGANASFLQALNLESEADLKGKKMSDFYSDIAILKKREKVKENVMQSGIAVYNEIVKVPGNEAHPMVWTENNYIPLRDKENVVIGVLVSGQNITSKVKADEILKMHSKNLEYLVEQRTQELGQKNREIKLLLQKIKGRNEELESIVEMRTQKLSESNKELMRSNNDLEQFAYIASHDLKEPLRIIGNFVGLLSRQYKSKLDKSAFEYIDFVEDGVSRMTGLINSLLTYSRVGRKEIAFQDTNLNNTLELKLLDLSQLIKERNIDVQVDRMPIIHCEKNQIGMVLHNLLTNAIKFNKHKNPRIKITHHQDAPEGFWKFSVADNGIGIPLEFQRQIFEIFRRLHTKQEYEGTGIGLALCHKIIDRHDGRIWVESVPGEGTTFFFTIDKTLKNKNIAKEQVPKEVFGLSNN